LKKKFKKIIILGKSKKFIIGIKKYYNFNNLKIVPWRRIINYKPNINEAYDLIFVCGFDFSAYHKNLDYFIKVNINHPIKLIKKISRKNTQIIYINTQNINKKNFTLSRYNFAKQQLGYQISKNFKNIAILKTDLILDKNKISIHSNYASKIVFLLLVKLKIIKTIEVKKIFIEINKLLNTTSHQAQKNMLGFLLKIPRTQFIDRFIRFLIG
tara:strand:- start:184 stop:819 length:636 start_codon:yes stop_codon:yes gene_type:complete